MRTIPDPGFADDAGGVDPELEEALAAYAADPPGGYAQALSVLQRCRLLVPVVAVLGEVEYDEHGLARDKTSDMASVLMQGRDGRLALLAFTSLSSMQAWNPTARPVLVHAARAAEAALQDDAAAMVVDVAGPVLFVVEGADLRSLGEGYSLVHLNGEFAWARSSVRGTTGGRRQGR